MYYLSLPDSMCPVTYRLHPSLYLYLQSPAQYWHTVGTLIARGGKKQAINRVMCLNDYQHVKDNEEFSIQKYM